MLSHFASVLFLCAGLTAHAEPRTSLSLLDGDRVVLVGGTLIEREQRYGYWETAVLLAHPELKLSFRNLGWSGDTVFGEARAGFGTPADGYKLLLEQIRATKPTVLLLAYGGNEAFDGPQGQAKFRGGLLHLLDDVAPLHARIVLMCPVLQPSSPVKSNEQISAYRQIIQSVGKERNLVCTDLLASPGGEPKVPPKSWSDDGIHFNARGYRESAMDFCRMFFTGKSAKAAESKLSAGGKEFPIRFDFPLAEAGAGEARMAISGLESGRYRLSQEDPTHDLATASSDDWAKGVVVHLSKTDAGLEKLRAEIIAKNVHYFNRYRPQNETYLFGFRKHEQGQNAREIPMFDDLVTEAEKRIADLRNEAKLKLILNRVD